MEKDEVTILVGSYADCQKAKAQLEGIPSKILSIPHNFKEMELVVPTLFEFAARSKLGLIQEDK